MKLHEALDTKLPFKLPHQSYWYYPGKIPHYLSEEDWKSSSWAVGTFEDLDTQEDEWKKDTTYLIFYATSSLASGPK
jgi:hypothetical protein